MPHSLVFSRPFAYEGDPGRHSAVTRRRQAATVLACGGGSSSSLPHAYSSLGISNKRRFRILALRDCNSPSACLACALPVGTFGAFVTRQVATSCVDLRQAIKRQIANRT
jgi:hypothetical protein